MEKMKVVLRPQRQHRHAKRKEVKVDGPSRDDAPSGDTAIARSTKMPLGLSADELSGATSLAVIIATSVAIGILVFLTHWAAPLLAPMLLGLMLTALASPLFARFVGRGRSPTVAMVITVIVLVIVGGAIALLSIYSGRQLTESLASYSDELLLRYPESSDTLKSLGLAGGLGDVIPPEVLVTALGTAASVVAEVGGNLAFALVLAALLLLDGPRLARLVGTGVGSQNPVFREVPAIVRSAITYFTIRIWVNLITASGLLLLMLVLGVDDPLLWAIGAFFLSFVPYVGLVFALIPPVILAFAESGPGAALAIIVGGAILNVVAENVLEPSMTGKALKLSTWVVFVMFFFTVWLLGPVGALVAMPITVLIVLVLKGNERTRWIASILTRDDPAPPSETAPSASTAG
jgi:AI-2 transport protein TqsA